MLREQLRLRASGSVLVTIRRDPSGRANQTAAINCCPEPRGVRTLWTADLPLDEQAARLTAAGCRISGRAISDRPGYPAIGEPTMAYRVVTFSEHNIIIESLGFNSDPVGFAGTELIRAAEPTIHLTAVPEDRLIAVGIALEAAGQLLGRVDGEAETYRQGRKSPTSVAHTYRVLRTVGLTTGQFTTTTVGLARGMAKRYNAEKHPNRALPINRQRAGVAALGLLILRIHWVREAAAYGDAASPYTATTS